MDPATARKPAQVPASFEDGLGVRHRAVGAANEPLEVLSLRDELTAVSSFEFALRERVSRLASFQHAAYGRVRGVERLGTTTSTLAVVSDHVPGTRLSEILEVAEAKQIPIDLNAALCLIRQLVPAVAMLHEKIADVSHGAIAPERVVLTPHTRLVIVEHVLGAALEQLRFSHERYWKELRIAMPRSAGLPRFDRRGDVTQIGVLALSLILGRPLRSDEYPERVAELADGAWAQSAAGGLGEPLPAPIRTWLMRALQVDLRTAFTSAIEARTELDNVLGVSNYIAEQTALEQFLAQYNKAAGTDRPATARTSAPTPVPPPPTIQIPVPAAVPTPAPASAATTPLASPPPIPSSPAPAPSPAPPVATAAPESKAGSALSTVAARIVSAVSAPPSPVVASSATEPTPPPSTQTAPSSPTRVATELDRSTSPLDESEEIADEEEVAMPKAIVSSRGRWIAAAAAIVVLASAGTVAARMFFAPAAAVETGTLEINTNPIGVEVLVDGQQRGATPLKLQLNPGNHQLELVTDGEHRKIPVSIVAGGQVTQFIELPETVRGRLQVRTEPSGAKVTVDGHAYGRTPLMVDSLAPGNHTVVLENEIGSLTEEVTIEAGTTASLVVPMRTPQGAPVSGWISVKAPIDLQIFEDDHLLGSSRTDRIMVPVGRHDLVVVNDALGFRSTRSINVSPGQVAAVRVEMPKGAMAINALPWAEAWVDGERIGETPIGNIAVPIGVHEVVLRHPELGEQRSNVTVTLSGLARVSVDLRKK